jgi:hypothetical protein
LASAAVGCTAAVDCTAAASPAAAWFCCSCTASNTPNPGSSQKGSAARSGCPDTLHQPLLLLLCAAACCVLLDCTGKGSA